VIAFQPIDGTSVPLNRSQSAASTSDVLKSAHREVQTVSEPDLLCLGRRMIEQSVFPSKLLNRDAIVWVADGVFHYSPDRRCRIFEQKDVIACGVPIMCD
jgi:hypothetical protein